jgi:hypothetical protein
MLLQHVLQSVYYMAMPSVVFVGVYNIAFGVEWCVVLPNPA